MRDAAILVPISLVNHKDRDLFWRLAKLGGCKSPAMRSAATWRRGGLHYHVVLIIG